MLERLKGLIGSLWAEHKAFRVAFVVTYLSSVIAIFVYFFFVAYSLLQPFFSWLALVCLSVYVASGRYQKDSRRKYWWLPLSLTSLSLAFLSYHNYTLDRLNDLVFSAFLCIVSVGCLLYYSVGMKSKRLV